MELKSPNYSSRKLKGKSYKQNKSSRRQIGLNDKVQGLDQIRMDYKKLNKKHTQKGTHRKCGKLGKNKPSNHKHR